jgi:hypothetical protein
MSTCTCHSCLCFQHNVSSDDRLTLQFINHPARIKTLNPAIRAASVPPAGTCRCVLRSCLSSTCCSRQTAAQHALVSWSPFAYCIFEMRARWPAATVVMHAAASMCTKHLPNNNVNNLCKRRRGGRLRTSSCRTHSGGRSTLHWRQHGSSRRTPPAARGVPPLAPPSRRVQAAAKRLMHTKVDCNVAAAHCCRLPKTIQPMGTSASHAANFPVMSCLRHRDLKHGIDAYHQAPTQCLSVL